MGKRRRIKVILKKEKMENEEIINFDKNQVIGINNVINENI